ncbi:MAD3 protein, partial [Rhinopomastus cyanomelas]|nr:MAD3 protein [Rhinopomastus cyanomelas]
MEPAASSIQVLLRAAEVLERRERPCDPPGLARAEHGYASMCPVRPRRATGSVRSVHNALEKHRYRGHGAGNGGGGQQELRAQKMKDWLCNRQQSLRQRLEWLLSSTDGVERVRADSLDSSELLEPSEGEDAEIEVDSAVFSGDPLPGFSTGKDHSYSNPHGPVS